MTKRKWLFAVPLLLGIGYLAVNPPSAEILWLGYRTQRKLGDNAAAIVYGRRLQTEFPDSDQAQQLRAGVDR